jgi:hypothetical protein
METVLIRAKKLSPAEEAFNEKVTPDVINKVIDEVREWNGGNLFSVIIYAGVLVSIKENGRVRFQGCGKAIYPNSKICPKINSSGMNVPVSVPGITVTVYRR